MRAKVPSATFTQPVPTLPAPYSIVDIAALQSLERGDATSEQQRRALSWIVRSAAGTYVMDYYSDPRDHAFAAGKRFVGLQIADLLNMDLAKIQAARVKKTT